MSGLDGDRALPHFQLLGPLRAWQGGHELDLGPSKQRAVLAVLLLNVNRPVATAQIVSAVWGDEPPENGANVVQKYVAGLRRVLEPDRPARSPGQVLTLTDAGYVLSVDPAGVDAEAFARQVSRALRERAEGHADQAAAALHEAFALWRGEALAGLSGPVFDSARDRLADSRAAALEAWAGLELELGRPAALVPRLVELVAEYPLREELRYQLVLALYRCGRQAEALAAYREARRFLADEFGVEPGERLQRLHRDILRSDPVLSAPPDLSPVPAGAVSSPYLPVLPRRRRRASWWPRAVAAAIPMVSCGFASWAVIAYYAARRHSPRLGVAAVGYFGLMVGFTMFMSQEGPVAEHVWSNLGIVCLLAATLGGSVHAILLSPVSHTRAALEERIRRDQARVLAGEYPGIARQLNVGRPDLARRYDDGGLVDVNEVPVEVLAALPGVTLEQARRIVADRSIRGTLSQLDELVTRQLVPAPTVDALRERLIVLS